MDHERLFEIIRLNIYATDLIRGENFHEEFLIYGMLIGGKCGDFVSQFGSVHNTACLFSLLVYKLNPDINASMHAHTVPPPPPLGGRAPTLPTTIYI